MLHIRKLRLKPEISLASRLTQERSHRVQPHMA